MFDKISDDFKMYCCSCDYCFNPYCYDCSIGYSPQEVYELFRNRACPKCGKNNWTHN